MEIVQLGLMQNVFDWVYDHILDPVWEFVSGLISSGFSYLSQVIPVVINAVMGTIIGEAISILLDWYYKKWFLFQSAILLLLDCIEDCFNVVSGLRPVYIRDPGVSGAVNGKGMPILYAVFSQQIVRNAFLAMIVVGFSLCFAMAILATARTILELGSEKTKPVTHIIKMTAKSLLYLALAPLISVALIMLSQTILTTIDRALTQGDSGKRTSIARIVFCISSLDAIDTFIHSDGEEYNVSYTDGPSKASVTDKFRKEFYYEDDHWLIPNYTNPILVRKTFTFHGFDYWISIGCGIFFTVVMCMVLSVFIGRIMDVIVLLIIEPFFVAMMPFDDGEYYKKWFELFLGKLFQGFGSVIAMRVYLMILEQLFSGSISFSNSKSLGARLQDYLMMLLFAMGGAVAVRHMGPLITGILSQAAASGEQAYAAAGWKVGSAIANKEASIVKKSAMGDVKKAGSLLGKGVGEAMKQFESFRKRKGGGGAGGPGGGGGEGDGIGKFEGGGRPGGLPSFGGNRPAVAGGASSAAQKSLASFRASALGGGAKGNGAGGKAALGGNKKPGGMNQSVLGAMPINSNPEGADKKAKSLQDMIGGAGAQGDAGAQGGKFNNAVPGGGAAGGKPPVGGNMGGQVNMKDIVGGGLNNGGGSNNAGGGLNNAGGAGAGGAFNNANPGGGNPGGGVPGAGGNMGGGYAPGGGGNMGGGAGNYVNMQDLVGGQVNLQSNAAGGGNLGGGNFGGGDLGGGQVNMQDIVGGGQKSMQDIVDGDGDDPLNTAFYGYDDDDGGAF